jgi:hypothetical protein
VADGRHEEGAGLRSSLWDRHRVSVCRQERHLQGQVTKNGRAHVHACRNGHTGGRVYA